MKPLRVLVACEFSGVVREEFLALGHDAYSCNYLPALLHPSDRHIIGDVRPLLRERWDLVVAHPPCTYLCNSGVRWLREGDHEGLMRRWERMEEACQFFKECLGANSERVCVENPVMHGHAKALVGPHTQVIQPWQFGHGETKATCLWLKGLPRLTPTTVVRGRKATVHQASPGPWRRYLRAVTYRGVGQAMAAQWSR